MIDQGVTKMYWKSTAYYLCKKEKRQTLLDISAELSRATPKSRAHYMADMIWCALRYGAMFTEYGDLDFAFRSKRNRATILTTFYNLKLYDTINPQAYRWQFHEKIEFLNTFASLIRRDWLSFADADDRQIEAFLRKHKRVVLKKSYGDSGKQVQVRNIPEDEGPADFRKYAEENGFDMAEQCLTNHPDIAVFNQTSLNTIRITTVQIGGKVDFLFAGLRVGAKGSALDNISQGGSVAKIDLNTGKIASEFRTKRSSSNGEGKPENWTGYQIPCWDAVKRLVCEAAMVIPQVGFVAWDVCVTENGPEIIEGNESFGSVVMQLSCSPTDPGLKPKLEEILRNGGIK